MPFPLLPFDENIITSKFHLLMISKPGIPISETVVNLQSDFSYPKTGLPPTEYIANNNLKYYYKRNNFILNKLIKNSWIDNNKIVVAGHSEGSYIALKMAYKNSKITNLIYSGGNPLGRMMSIINQDRLNPKEKENWFNEDINQWKKIVLNKDIKEINQENTSYYSFTLSSNFTKDLLSLNIPVLVTYGTKDQNAIFNDYLQVLTIEASKKNYSFITYFNCEHNFFPKLDNKIDYETDNWTKVANDWVKWLF
jgi:hypothetical protein